MFKFILIIFALSYALCEDSNKTAHERLENLSKEKLGEKVKPKLGEEDDDSTEKSSEENSDDSSDDNSDEKTDVVPKPEFDFKKFLKEIKGDVVNYANTLKKKKLSIEQLKEVTNKFLDKVLQQLRNIIDSDLTPLPLPDREERFESTVLVVPVVGKLQLTHGNLTNLRRIKRSKSVEIKGRRNIMVKIPLIVDHMEFEFDYSASLLGVGPSGKVIGTVRNSRADLKVYVSPATREITNAEFIIQDRGKISFDIDGNLLNKVLNVLKSVVSGVVDKIFVSVFDNFIDNELDIIVDDINAMLEEIIQMV